MTRRWSCILTVLYLLSKVHQYLPFNLALVRYPRFVYAVQAVGSSVVQTTRLSAVSHLPGFNWAVFTWQGTRRHTMRCALAVRRGSTAEPVRVCAVACCATHMINYFRSKCKLCLGTIYCAFKLKIAHFRRFEHNILWWQ